MKLLERHREGQLIGALFGWDFVKFADGRWYFKLRSKWFYFRYRSYDKTIWEWNK